MLREEVQTTLAQHGGTLTSRALQQMLKLDSYMKECMRFYPPGEFLRLLSLANVALIL